jgi:hypothetical protein
MKFVREFAWRFSVHCFKTESRSEKHAKKRARRVATRGKRRLATGLAERTVRGCGMKFVREFAWRFSVHCFKTESRSEKHAKKRARRARTRGKRRAVTGLGILKTADRCGLRFARRFAWRSSVRRSKTESRSEKHAKKRARRARMRGKRRAVTAIETRRVVDVLSRKDQKVSDRKFQSVAIRFWIEQSVGSSRARCPASRGGFGAGRSLRTMFIYNPHNVADDASLIQENDNDQARSLWSSRVSGDVVGR